MKDLINLRKIATLYPKDRVVDGETVLDLIARLEQAEQAVARVLEEHSERVLKYPSGAEEHYCAYYHDSAWPCNTIRALDGEQP